MRLLSGLTGLVLLLCPAALATHSGRQLLGQDSHSFQDGDEVDLLVNKVGPFKNPSETYQYYTLPFCQPATKKFQSEGFGELLAGDRAANSLYKFNFRRNSANETLCTQQLDRKEVEQFRKAVENEYYFQVYIDDLPVFGFIGRTEKVDHGVRHVRTQFSYYLYTHFHFDIAYNGDRIVTIDCGADAHSSRNITVPEAQDITFTYSVKWTPTTKRFDKRMERWREDSFLPQHMEIHWFSIINSGVLVLLLLGILVTIFMRVLKHDFAKFSRDDELGDDADETGWKYVHGDVFRLPKHVNLLCAILGCGTQIGLLTFAIFALHMAGSFSPMRSGSVIATAIILYALTASLAGYVSGYYYKMFGGTQWVRNVLLTAALFSGPMVATFAVLNTVALAYRSTQALPFTTIVLLVFMWALVTFPLTILGGILAKNKQVTFDAPCRTTKYPREIPPLPWYRATLPQMAIAGFLPFSAIYIELHYIFTSVWGHKDFTVFSVLLVVFCILLAVTATITVVLTYFQLAVEDHRWWWRAMLCGGCTGIFVYAYTFYFHMARSSFSSFMQVSRYYGYMGMVCYALFLILSSVGFTASMAFVRLIYRSIKSD